jgi:hypothetical protein
MSKQLATRNMVAAGKLTVLIAYAQTALNRLESLAFTDDPADALVAYDKVAMLVDDVMHSAKDARNAVAMGHKVAAAEHDATKPARQAIVAWAN